VISWNPVRQNSKWWSDITLFTPLESMAKIRYRRRLDEGIAAARGKA